MFAPVFSVDPKMTIYDLLSKPGAMPYLEQQGQHMKFTKPVLGCLGYNPHQDIMLLLKPYIDAGLEELKKADLEFQQFKQTEMAKVEPPTTTTIDPPPQGADAAEVEAYNAAVKTAADKMVAYNSAVKRVSSAQSKLKTNLEWAFQNIHAVPLIEYVVNNHIDCMSSEDWACIGYNPNALHIVMQFPNKFDTKTLCCNTNPNVLPLIVERLSKMTEECWTFLSDKSYAIPLLEQYPDKIHWLSFSQNQSAEAMLLWRSNLDKLDWSFLSRNPTAVPLLEQYPDRISYVDLGRNPAAFHLISKNMDKMSRRELCKNPCPKVIELLDTYVFEEPMEKFSLRCNPNAVHLFMPLNLEKMREKCKPFAEELFRYVLHPARLMRLADMFEMEMEDYVDLI